MDKSSTDDQELRDDLSQQLFGVAYTGLTDNQRHRIKLMMESVAAHTAKAVEAARKEGQNELWGKTYEFLHFNYKAICDEWEAHINEGEQE